MPNDWGNVDQITLECSRIVLVVQCFAVGVELPKVWLLASVAAPEWELTGWARRNT